MAGNMEDAEINTQSENILADNQEEQTLELPEVPVRTNVPGNVSRSQIPRLRRPLVGRRVVSPVRPIDSTRESDNENRRPASIAGERKKNRTSRSRQRSYPSSDESSNSESDTETSNYEEEHDTDCGPSASKKRQRNASISSTSTKQNKKYNLFEATSEKDRRQWDLPQELADYFNTNARKFIADKDIQETIIDDFPVPKNIDNGPVMDDFMTSMLSSSSGGHMAKEKDRDLCGIHSKIRYAMGPLAVVWKDIEQFRNGESTEPVDVDSYAENFTWSRK